MEDSTRTPPVIFLMGPTASGKTDAAIDIVQSLPCEIISVDSAMVYRGMDIGTAKPSAAELALASHRLIDILDPAEVWSAGQFRSEALTQIAEIHAQGRIPLLTGGTMMYFNALEKGLARLPSADATLRARLEEEARQLGWAALHQRLAEQDPQAAQQIHPNDPQRIQRALEVIELTGRPMSVLQQETTAASGFPFPILKIALAPSRREVLHQRIAGRFGTMLKVGLIEEVEALRARGDLHRDLPSIRCVGYRQVWDFLEGGLSQEEMTEKAVIATRQLAKRQMTWLRSMAGVQWVDSLDENYVKKIGDMIGAFLA